MASFEWEFSGLDDLLANLQGLPDDLERNVGRAMYQGGESMMAASKETVPVDKGALMNSGYVKPPEVVDGILTVELGYGGQSVDYAATVHENLNPHVRWKRPGSGPKFLENAITAGTYDYLEGVTDAARSTIAK